MISSHLVSLKFLGKALVSEAMNSFFEAPTQRRFVPTILGSRTAALVVILTLKRCRYSVPSDCSIFMPSGHLPSTICH